MEDGEDLYDLNHLNMQDVYPQVVSLPPTFSLDSMSAFDIMPVDRTHLTKPPNLEEIETNFQFEVGLPGEQSGKGTWIYSATLRKVFIKMKQIFTVNISYNNHGGLHPGPLHLRVMPIFTEPDDQHHAVERCLNHATKDGVKPHILWCNNQNALYQGEPDKVNYGERLSILVPLSAVNFEASEQIGFEFHCQNSCSTGINRRCTAMVFSLENSQEQIVGKRVMHFKVCSCPKRDKEKEEDALASRTEGAAGGGGGNAKRGLKRERDRSPSCSRSKKVPSKIIVKQEVPSPPTDEHGNPTGVSATITMPNQAMMNQVLDFASALVGNAMVDHPNSAQFLETFRTTLRMQKSDQPQSDSQGSM